MKRVDFKSAAVEKEEKKAARLQKTAREQNKEKNRLVFFGRQAIKEFSRLASYNWLSWEYGKQGQTTKLIILLRDEKKPTNTTKRQKPGIL